jgi:hypothetical protein
MLSCLGVFAAEASFWANSVSVKISAVPRFND